MHSVLGVSHLDFVIFYWLFCLFLSTHSINRQTRLFQKRILLLLAHWLFSLYFYKEWLSISTAFAVPFFHGFVICFSDAYHFNFWENRLSSHLTYSQIDQYPLTCSDKRSKLSSKSLNFPNFCKKNVIT